MPRSSCPCFLFPVLAEQQRCHAARRQATLGAPLVLKSDNGSAFKGEVVRLLADWRVIPLLSPARTPRYNGSCEAGNGALATRTHYQAALAGHAGFRTSDDVEAARRQGNAFHYPDG